MKLKIAAAFLMCFVFFVSLAACANSNDTKNDATDYDGTKQDFTEEKQSIFDALPQNNFNGDTFAVLVSTNPDNPVDRGTYAEQLTGDRLNDAVYNRNLAIEGRYNVKINAIQNNNINTYDTLKKDVLAGDLRADVYFTHTFQGAAPSVADGLLREWGDVPYLDFEKPWWNSTAITNLKIAGKTYYISGSMTLKSVLALVFNKQMVQDLALEDPYALVRSGKWTIDKLNEIAAAASLDLNGDGKYDKDNDRYGLEYGISWQAASLMYACGEISVVLDDAGYPNLDIESPKKILAYEKIYNLLYDGIKSSLYTGNHPYMGIDSGRVLFCQYNLYGIEQLRESVVDYGILPLPKYDENQAKHLCNAWYGMYGLPVNMPDGKLELIGSVMESMSALGHTDVMPAYYDILLKEKVTRDDDSIEMLEIIFDGIVYDLGLNFQAGPSHPGFFIIDLIASKNPNYASGVEKIKDKMIADYDSLYTTIVGIGK